MQTAGIVLQQVIVMFLLVALGYWLFKIGKITPEGSKTIGNVLIYLVLPTVIIKGFLVERTAGHAIQLALSAVAACVVLGISILVSRMMFKRNPIAHFASAFSNPGFFGIPLIVASLGNEAVFYVAALVGALNMGQWTYGVAIMTERPGRLKLKTLLKAPFAVAILVGLALFASGIQLPELVTRTMTFVTNMNTPLAMLTIGVYLAQTDIPKMFVDKSLYLVSLARLIIIPILCLLVLRLLTKIIC